MFKNKKITIGLILISSIALIIGAVFLKPFGNTHAQKDVYYCPMHPTYTSDRPGTCPICNMTLVKKEISPSMSEARQVDKHLKDICIMHHCHKGHDGKPCPMMVLAKKGEKVTCPICGTHIAGVDPAQKEKKILFWTDPMIPGYKAQGPGKSPMGMDLVPVYEEDTASSQETVTSVDGYVPVLVAPQKRQLIGIKTAVAAKRQMVKTIRSVGTVAHDPELYQAQTEYLQALRGFEQASESNMPEIAQQAERLLEASKIRLRHMGLNEEMIAELGKEKEADHSLLFSGSGQIVWVYAQIYEYEIPYVKVGQTVKAIVPSLGDKVFEGAVRAIDPMVDQTTRTTRVRIQVQDPEGLLKPETYLNVNTDVQLGETLAVSQEAVFDTGTRKIVFVDQGEGLFVPKEVKIGMLAGGYYEVKEGLSEGEKIVVSGNFLIDSESRLKSAMDTTQSEKSEGQGGPSHGQ